MITSDERQQVKALFDATRERPMTERASLLDEAYSDQTIRKEVESLLAAHDSDKDFLIQPACELFAGMLAEDRPELDDHKEI